jgi:hypothetical protein
MPANDNVSRCASAGSLLPAGVGDHAHDEAVGTGHEFSQLGTWLQGFADRLVARPWRVLPVATMLTAVGFLVRGFASQLSHLGACWLS